MIEYFEVGFNVGVCVGVLFGFCMCLGMMWFVESRKLKKRGR